METLCSSSESSQGEHETTGSVVFVSQQFPPDRSGHASRLSALATTLADEGWDVSVLTPPPSFPHGEFERSWRPTERTQIDGVEVVRLWTVQPTSPDPGFLTRMAFYVLFAVHATLWLLARRHEHDVLVTTTPPISTGVAGLATVRADTRWVVDVRDLWIDASVSLGFISEGGLLERGSRRFQRGVLSRADRLSVTTETLGERLCEQYGAELEAKLLLVPNGVDTERFQRPETAATNSGPPVEAVRRDGGENERTPKVVIYTGNIGHAQNLDECVRALETLPEDVILRLVGGGDAVEDLEQLATDRGVRHRVEFVGTRPHEEIPELIGEAQVGLAPLRDDAELGYAMPTKVYEYLGSGVPVVTTGRGELERFIDRSGGGIHAESDDQSIATAIETLLEDDDLRVETGRRGSEYVCERYDRKSVAREFSQHLCRLVAATEVS